MIDMTQFEIGALFLLFCLAMALVTVSQELSKITDSLRRIDGNIDRIAVYMNNRNQDIYGDDDD